MTKQEQFFYDNAGFGYDPKTETEEQGKERCAKKLAEAERFADIQGWQYEIEDDPYADDSWMSEEDRDQNTEPAISVLLNDGQGGVESLSGIFGATLGYIRVVKAELALQHMQDSDFADFVPVADIPLAVSK